jgi:HTH-type transcriptional regulator, cell division transcriptional repressor
MDFKRRELPKFSGETVSERIKEVREARGLTASELARRVGVTATAVWNWEKNAVTPRRPVLDAIASVLGVAPAFILTGNNEGASAASDAAGSVASIVRDARVKLAEATGLPLDCIRLDVHFTSE